MNLNFLTNPDPIRQEKMRFFADYFLYVNEYLGKLPDIPFDNPYSLLDKIIFQIEKNPERFHIFIGNYFRQFFTFFETKESKNDIEALTKLYKQYHCKKNKKEWVDKNPDFISEIRKLHAEFKTKLFENNFSTLFSFINCPCSLKKHQNAIRYCVQILVSQFRLNGYSKSHVDSSIDRILSRDDQFPFPPHIAEIKDNIKLKKAKEEYLGKRDFKEQFFGLKHMLTRPEYQNGIFIFAIDNCNLDNDINDTFKVQFNQVTFISPTHDLLKNLREFINNNNSYININKTFFKDGVLLAYISLNYDELSFAKDKALAVVIQELKQFNSYINTELRVNTKHYLFSRDFLKIEGGRISMGENTFIRTDQFKYLEKNAYSELRSTISNAKTQILDNEETFFRSIEINDITLYWQYIENTLWPLNLPSAAEIQKKFSKLLFQQIHKLKKDFFLRINSLIIPFFGFDYKEIGLEDEDIFISEGIMKVLNPKVNILRLEKKIKSPFLKYAIDYYKEFDSIKQNRNWNEYMQSLILELYEYRNNKLHTGMVNCFADIKLKETLPIIINKVRWDLIYTCKANPDLSFKEIINLLTENKFNVKRK